MRDYSASLSRVIGGLVSATVLSLAATVASAQQTSQIPEGSFPEGEDAINELSTRLPAVAARYGLTAEELRREFRRNNPNSSSNHSNRGRWVLRSDDRIAVTEVPREQFPSH